MEEIFLRIYSRLMELYGPQGWWPLTQLHDRGGSNPTKSGSLNGYHPGDHSYPHTEEQQFEIICGALLTQNTGWPQVEKALLNLMGLDALSPKGMLELDIDILKEAIRPAGYYNQKSQRLKVLAEWFSNLDGRVPSREEVLSLKGVGPETADSIMLYAFKQPCFVVDTYTKRIMTNLGLVDEDAGYDDIKAVFENNLPEDIGIYQEYHALLVEHAKRYYQKKANYGDCPLLKMLGK